MPGLPILLLHSWRRYDCAVSGISVGGNFIVQFEGYGSQEEVERSAVRERPQTAANEGPGYKGAALRRRAHAFWHLS
jgi:hypothetical protein